MRAGVLQAYGVLAMMLGLCAAGAEATVYKTFLLGGQPNMTGNGLSNELTREMAAPFPAVRIFHGHQAVNGWTAADGYWDDLKPGFPKDPARFGPELTFGRGVAQRWAGEPMALVMYAKASGLAADWQPTPPNNTQRDLFWLTDYSRLTAARP